MEKLIFKLNNEIATRKQILRYYIKKFRSKKIGGSRYLQDYQFCLKFLDPGEKLTYGKVEYQKEEILE